MRKTGIVIISFLLYSLSAYACTGFYVCRGNRIYAGNNEDHNNPRTKMWIMPPEKGSYGRIFFGYDDYYPQGGINEKGLFFDGFATEPKKVLKSVGKPHYDKIYDNFQNEILSTCATVDEVIAFVRHYNLDFLERGMFFFGDAKGESIIIEGDSILRKKGDFQIVTNFYQSQTTNITCERYKTAYKMLTKTADVSINRCRDILNATHAENADNATLYSQVYDIKDLIIYIYNFHNYNDCIKIDLNEALKKGRQYYDLPSLFPKSTSFELFEKRYNEKHGYYLDQRKPKKEGNIDLTNRLGYYFNKSLIGPKNKSYPVDSIHLLSLSKDNDRIIYTELYGQGFRCVLEPEVNNRYSYKSDFGQLSLTFSDKNPAELNCEIVLSNNDKYTWICRKTTRVIN